MSEKATATGEFVVKVFNITSVHSKAAAVMEQAMDGLHAVTETKADVIAINSTLSTPHGRSRVNQHSFHARYTRPRGIHLAFLLSFIKFGTLTPS